MAASAVIELDTRPPEVVWDPPTEAEAGTVLVIPYSVDEPGVWSVEVLDVQGNPRPASDEGTHIEVPLNKYLDHGIGRLRVTFRDEVWNESTFVGEIMFSNPRLPLFAWIDPSEATASVAGSEAEAWVEGGRGISAEVEEE